MLRSRSLNMMALQFLVLCEIDHIWSFCCMSKSCTVATLLARKPTCV